MRIAPSVCILVLSALPARTAVKTLVDFENDRDLISFEQKKKSGRQIEDGATHGSKALEISSNEYMVAWRTPPCGDWSGYDLLCLDVDNRTGEPVRLSVLVGDEAWKNKDGGTYWNRHNSSHTIPPGRSTFSLPIKGLFRGEAGSRNNDIKENIDISRIVRLDLGFKGREGKVIIDWLRLESAAVPEGVTALDFGPESQPLYPGFTAVTWNTLFEGDSEFGFHPRRRPWGKNRGRDDTFPNPLYRDFVETNECLFSLKVKPGKNHCFLVYDDCGYWGGEQARHHHREIRAEGRLVYSENRPLGWATVLYKFEDKEMLPDCDVWNQYVAEIFRPVRFQVDVPDGVLELEFNADNHWSSKVAALIVFHEDDKTEGEQFLSQLQAKLEKDFRNSAVELPLPEAGEVPEEWLQGDAPLIFPVSKDRDVYPNTVPTRDDYVEQVAAFAFQGEREPISFGIRTLGGDEKVTATVSDLNGPGVIPSRNTTISTVRYLGKRGFNSVAWRLEPWHMLPEDSVVLSTGVTRQFWVDVHVPADAPPGKYSGEIRLKRENADGGALGDLAGPIEIEVLPARLRGTDFIMGFYGVTPPGMLPEGEKQELQRQIFQTLRDVGMTSFSGGPNYHLRGFENGQPILDFAAVDEFMHTARSLGFRLPVNGYGGLSLIGLYDRHGYVKGGTGAKLEEETGLDYEEICRRTWGAVLEHARQEEWPPFYVAMCDETRVREHAVEQLKLMKLFRKVAPDLLIAGSYSVSFQHKAEPGTLEWYHQEFFRTLRVNMLNRHDQSVIDKAKELGSDLFIYNQGRDRFTFGYYQWAEYAKGIKGRYQWHLFPLHGFQYFDLDGREPDNGVICYHSEYGVIPTINLMRIREGVDDFLYLQTLHDLVQEKPVHPSAEEGRELLKKIESGIAVNDRRKPDWLDMDATRRRIADLIVQLSE